MLYSRAIEHAHERDCIASYSLPFQHLATWNLARDGAVSRLPGEDSPHDLPPRFGGRRADDKPAAHKGYVFGALRRHVALFV